MQAVRTKRSDVGDDYTRDIDVGVSDSRWRIGPEGAVWPSWAPMVRASRRWPASPKPQWGHHHDGSGLPFLQASDFCLEREHLSEITRQPQQHLKQAREACA